MDFPIPAGCRAVMERLASFGYPAYLVGGCVRDLCRGVAPNDYDLTTPATPDEMKRVFDGFRVIQTGIAHGTLTVLSDGRPYEITTYRVDGSYSDGRHPDGVSFTSSLEEDLLRRDFTVNAMAYAPDAGLIDLFGGQADLAARLIRAVGDPDRRFTEDSLRILRALRFASTLGFSIEEKTARALLRLAPTVRRVSPERIREELFKLLSGSASETVLIAYRDALFAAVPFLAKIGDEWTRAARAAAKLSSDPTLSLAALARSLGEGETAALFRALRTDRKSERRAAAAVAAYRAGLPSDCAAAGLFLVDFGDAAYDAVSLAEAYGDPAAAAAKDALDAFRATGRPTTLSALAVRGDDLLSVGIPSGPVRGEILARLLRLAATGTVENEREALLSRAARREAEKRDQNG